MRFPRCDPLALVLLLSLAICARSQPGATREDLEGLEDFVNENVPGFVGKIIGGKETKPGAFPWMVSLRFPDGISIRRKDMSGKHFCGGALIAKNVVLTAGHCLVNRLLKKPVVHIGRYFREGDDEGRFETFQTKETRPHPNFKNRGGGVYDFDVELIVLDGDSKVTPIGLRTDEECFEENSRCAWGKALGWGLTVSGDEESAADRLLLVDVPLVPRAKCGEKLETTISDAMVCAGEKGKDACQLDSGGPLLVGRKIGGVTSWGKECGGDQPGVYGNVGGVFEWIDRELKDISGEVPKKPLTKPPPKKPAGCSFRFGRYFPPGCNRRG